MFFGYCAVGLYFILNNNPNDLGNYNDFLALVFLPVNVVFFIGSELFIAVSARAGSLKGRIAGILGIAVILGICSLCMPFLLEGASQLLVLVGKNFYLGHQNELANMSVVSSLAFTATLTVILLIYTLGRKLAIGE